MKWQSPGPPLARAFQYLLRFSPPVPFLIMWGQRGDKMVIAGHLQGRLSCLIVRGRGNRLAAAMEFAHGQRTGTVMILVGVNEKRVTAAFAPGATAH